MELTSKIEEALIAESARWGDYRRESPYTVAKDFSAVRADLLDNWFPHRSRIVLDQFRDRDLYPKLQAPVFSQHGGYFDGPDFSLTMTSKSVNVFLPGTRILFTQDGSDPRLPGGAINASAIVYRGSIPVVKTSTIKARVENESTWSALNEALFVVGAQPASSANLLFSVVHYHPSPPTAAELAAGFESSSAFEYVELINPGDEPVSLLGLRLVGGIRFDFDQGKTTEIAAGSRVRLVKNATAYTIRTRGSAEESIDLLGEYQGKLANDGETLAIIDRFGQTRLTLAYSDSGDWPREADGDGPALRLIHPRPGMDLSDPQAWTAEQTGQDIPWNIWLDERPVSDPHAPFGSTGLTQMAAFFLAADLDPNPPYMNIAALDRDTLALSFPRRAKAETAMVYHLEESDDLMEWRRVEPTKTTVVALTENVDEITARLPRGRAFLRVLVELR